MLIHKYSLALLSLVLCSLRYPDMYYGRIELFEMPGQNGKHLAAGDMWGGDIHGRNRFFLSCDSE